jgi:ribosome-interacting GTPase 1
MEAMCKQIHNTLTREFKYALVWGVSAKHSPQRVGLIHQLSDEDVVQVTTLSCLQQAHLIRLQWTVVLI